LLPDREKKKGETRTFSVCVEKREKGGPSCRQAGNENGEVRRGERKGGGCQFSPGKGKKLSSYVYAKQWMHRMKVKKREGKKQGKKREMMPSSPSRARKGGGGGEKKKKVHIRSRPRPTLRTVGGELTSREKGETCFPSQNLPIQKREKGDGIFPVLQSGPLKPEGGR